MRRCRASSHYETADDNSNGDKLLTRDDVADLMRVTPRMVYAENRGDAIPYLRPGRYVRHRRAAIEAWMRTVERESGSPTARADSR